MQDRDTGQQFYGGGAAPWQMAGLTLSESVYPAGLKMPRHQHEPAYFGIVLQGGYAERMGLAGQEREGAPLTTAFHPEGEAHAVRFGDKQTRVFRIELGTQWRRRVALYGPLPDEPLQFGGGPLSALTLRLYREYQQRDAWSGLAIEGLSLEIMAHMARRKVVAPTPEIPPWVGAAREILSSRLSDIPSLGELAEMVGIHPVHLSRAFRRYHRCTISEYVRQMRIEAACRAIAETDAPISEIALAAGFYDQSHFSNTFKRCTGVTPASWRAQCRAR